MASSTPGLGRRGRFENWTYYIEFIGANGVVTPTVQSFGAVQFSGGAGGAQVRLNVNAVTDFSNQHYNPFFLTTAISKSLNAINNPNATSDSFSIDGPIQFWANEVYSVEMLVSVGAQDGSSASAYVDPYFLAPDGYSLSILSSGIGNAPAVAATPIPATLPLFATGLVGQVGWRGAADMTDL